MSDLSANLSMPYLAPAQAQKHLTHNEALLILDAVVQLGVESRSLSAPPADPPQGARYILAGTPGGDWAGQAAGRLALRDGTGWLFLAPRPGWRAAVLDEGGAEVLFREGAWQAAVLPADLSAERLGLNAGADAVNRLAVSAAATLLSHEGAGHRLKINKAAAGETASLLFQTGWSGRAEMGTAGAEDFVLKVSADGSAWTEALRAEAATGRVVLPQGVRLEGAVSGPGLVGTVARSGGQSSGAVIERGSGAGGDYVRWADGTQICWHVRTAGTGGAVDWDFPAGFAAGSPPVVQATAQGGGAHFASLGTATASGVAVSAWDGTGARVAVEVALTATGRWA